jgi:2'-5' RNA ligase
VNGPARPARQAARRTRTRAGRLLGPAVVWLRPKTALLVPVLAAQAPVAAWLGQDQVTFDGAPLHVTAMYPFLGARSIGAAEEAAVAELASQVEPFGFTLARLGRFPGVHYLAPEPAAPFVDITERIQRRWPSCRPYGGVYEAIVPHVTIAFGDTPPADLATLERQLPISTGATELWLIEQTWRGWRTRRRFPLGRGSTRPEAGPA